ncbi:MAG: hypothetical protein UT30_C0008G0011 [Candidatus Uhrbacteria bacterium GW2011_GWF2_39_13]|uniref:Zinc-binding alcohol dehydrogenase n=1 Tax=Candidatus Uhrbacteria bacterium GW2011_GWF2_39_13 TaxID=1618995 RepID=A0A0G0MK27_9BACT|nr:MAG: hypothetical protein UT30_C0008G0011 [Candidatus Uhrbacteria bacterium GW2011_GWF2_39_13]
MNGYRVVFPEKGKVDIEKFKIPELKENEILVKTVNTLISSGTEIAILRGAPNTKKQFPVFPGYLNAGEIIKKGKNVKSLKIGDRVVSYGIHASHVIVPVESSFNIPQNLSSEDAVFSLLASISLQGIRKSNIELGSKIAIIGQGLIGLLATRFARMNGAFPVIAVDISDLRLKTALSSGADYSINVSKDNLQEKIRTLISDKYADIVIVAVETSSAILEASKIVKDMGKIILLGSPRDEESKINFYSDIHYRGISIIGAHARNTLPHNSFHGCWTRQDDINLIIKLLCNKKLIVKDLISHRFDYSDIIKVYNALTLNQEKYLGVIVKW